MGITGQKQCDSFLKNIQEIDSFYTTIKQWDLDSLSEEQRNILSEVANAIVDYIQNKGEEI